MNSIRRLLLSAALVATLTFSLAAQEAQTGFHSIACYKVKPEKLGDFHNFINTVVLKLAQSRVDSGAIAGWVLLRTVIPAGSESDCDYSAVTFYKGFPTEALSSEALTEALHKAGLSLTGEEYRDRGAAVATLSYNNITQTRILVGGVQKGDYVVFNTLSVTDSDECVSDNKKVWQPYAEQLIKEGILRGWAVNVQVLPSGTKDRALASTVDIYTGWDAYFKWQEGFYERWKKVHPDMEVGTAFEQLEKYCTITNNAISKVEESVQATKK
jgi:hypothetical protein